MPKLTIIRGLPGSGKSTMAKAMCADLIDGKTPWHVEADMFFINAKGEYQFNPDLVPNAHDWCQHVAARQLELGFDVVVSNTFSRRWEISPYIAMADTLGCDVEVVCCTKNFGNVHNVPDHVIDRMAKRWQKWDGEQYV